MSAELENQSPDSAVPPGATARKPHLSLFIATAAGLGYLPKAPGTWGSLVGVLIYLICYPLHTYYPLDFVPGTHVSIGLQAMWAWWSDLPISLIIAAVGVWVSSRVAAYSQQKDPQFVVVDEVSGQHLTYVLGFAALNWKYLLLGLILFRLFDIWKPFPARQAESLPGGWGIMADDWMAGVYAAILLRVALHFNLV